MRKRIKSLLQKASKIQEPDLVPFTRHVAAEMIDLAISYNLKAVVELLEAMIDIGRRLEADAYAVRVMPDAVKPGTILKVSPGNIKVREDKS